VTGGTSPVARELARVAAARDAARLAKHEDAHRYGWVVEYDGDVLVTVTLRARAAHFAPDEFETYLVTLDCDSYDLWPPETRFVTPETRTYTIGQDTRVLPRTQRMPGFAIHPRFDSFYTRGRVDQLVCFSFTRGYYDSSHTPGPRERWTPGRHWLYTTVRVLHRALQPPYYLGRMA
jgi:hypothetical protein